MAYRPATGLPQERGHGQAGKDERMFDVLTIAEIQAQFGDYSIFAGFWYGSREAFIV